MSSPPATQNLREYALLILPSANRVYGAQAAELALAELSLVGSMLSCRPQDETVATIGGVEYLRFRSPELGEQDIFVVSNLSVAYGLFEIIDGRDLRPVDLQRLAHYPSDLITIQRFTGKTNEQFTHLLVNVATAVSRAAHERAEQRLPVRLLDPVAGRGTTLNRALVYGYDAAGVEIDATNVEAYRTFLTTYLKDHRHKFKSQEENHKKGPLAGTKRFTVEIDSSQKAEMIRGDASRVDEYFGAKSFDLLVADLPYGVQHRAATPQSVRRSPTDLVAASAPAWRTVLRSGAGVALAFNTKTLGRGDAEAALADAGFSLVPAPRSFLHKVDRAVTRDVIVAVT